MSLVYDTLRVKVRRNAAVLSPTGQRRLFALGLIASDALGVILAFRLAFFIRFELALPIFRLEVVPSIPHYQRLSLLLAPSFLLIFAMLGLYNRRNLLGGVREYDLLFRGVSTSILLLVVAGFLESVFVFARGWLLLVWAIAFVGTALGRFTLRRVVYHLRQHGLFLTPALIIGANEEARSLAHQLLGWRTSGLLLLGLVDDDATSSSQPEDDLSVLGPLAELDRLIAQHQVTELILATSALSRDCIIELFMKYGLDPNLNLRLSSGLYEVFTTSLRVQEMGFVSFVGVSKVRMTGIERILKLLVDYLCAIPALLLLSPLLVGIAIAVRRESPGPILYRRRVVGLHGREFDAFKFRTMFVNGAELLRAQPALEAELARSHKLKEDPRVTRLGRFLRKYSLDELPQLFNVLKREMSLVGPRMITPHEMEMFGQLSMNRLTVLPGITGLWQVSGRSNLSYDERVRLDMYYIRNWTIWLDVQLLFQTIPAVLRGRGAY